MSIFVPILPTDPVVATKQRVNASDLLNPRLPNCSSQFWIVDGNTVREMTQAEKDQRWPPEVIRPKKWCKQQILLIEDTPPYKVSRGLEESITIQPQEAQDRVYIKVRKIITLKTDLRAIVAADPDTWAAGQQEALQVRIDEVIGWSA